MKSNPLPSSFFCWAILFAALFAINIDHVVAQTTPDEKSKFAKAAEAIEAQLKRAGENREQLELALKTSPVEQRSSVEFLIQHMSKQDLKSLASEFLLENVRLAHQARSESAWKISDELFLNDVLPYANVDETREAWRAPMYERAKAIVKDCKTPGEAAQRLNEKLFKQVQVKYSTKRKKANQSPSESMDQGLASCTGLSILLVDACRSVNVPARLVGIPSWRNKRGNHTWVEVWDNDQWNFTGAAEYNAKGLNRAWFQNDAALADKQSQAHSIYAVSFKRTPTVFPMVWSRGGSRSYAVNVTDRYTPKGRVLGEDEVRVMVRVKSETGSRVEVPITITALSKSKVKLHGTSRGETADMNDLLSFDLKRSQEYQLNHPRLDAPMKFQAADADQQTIELVVATEPQESDTKKTTDDSASTAKDPKPLSKEQAAKEINRQHGEYLAKLKKERSEEWNSKVIELGKLKMKFDYRKFGEEPKDGHSLFISMHGGGSAPPRVNEQQWRNQIGLYQPEEGIYLAPRAPTNTWNLWHEPHIDQFFARIIEDAMAIEGVNPNRVYIMGYSAGGDGVYQLAPRMADQLAAAAMMAGHPNGVSPIGLRNIGFTLHMGGKDAAYKRNKIAAQWKEKLAKLKQDDPDGYEHEVVIYPNSGHWMDKQDAVAVPWMAKFTRDPLPKKIAWRQTGVTHSRFYWLAVDEKNKKRGSKIIISRNGNEFTIHETVDLDHVIIRLNDEMVDFEKPIVVLQGADKKATAFENVSRNAKVIKDSLAGRGDLNAVFTAEIKVKIHQPPKE